MSLLDQTLASLAPGVSLARDIPGRYNPKHGLGIYFLPIRGYTPSAPGVVLGEALAARSGLGCTLLDGIPAKIPEGAVVIGLYSEFAKAYPHLLADIPPLTEPGQYAIRIDHHATIVSNTIEGLAQGMQTLAMLVLRHNEDTLPGSVIVDTPLCRYRGLAVEVQGGEITANLLMQMLSFAATFKANHFHLILTEPFPMDREIPGLETFIESCASYGIGLELRFPFLGRMLSGNLPVDDTFNAMYAVAKRFGATALALDDPVPPDAPQDAMQAVVNHLLNAEREVAVSADIQVFLQTNVSGATMREKGLTGWTRLTDGGVLPTIPDDMPVRVDVEANLPGFSHRPAEKYHACLDQALAWLEPRRERELMVSFRHVGVSHMWQNMLYPAATGLIAGWGSPRGADQCAWIFSNLLYGDSSAAIMNLWNAISNSFPAGLTALEEQEVRRTAFGHWPENNRTAAILGNINWLETANAIRAAAETLKNAASGLSRNASTLTGAKLSLHALSWLHCFVALASELEARRSANTTDEDGRTGSIAYELMSNYTAWYNHVESLAQESGLEVSELPVLEAMGQQLRALCESVTQ